MNASYGHLGVKNLNYDYFLKQIRACSGTPKSRMI